MKRPGAAIRASVFATRPPSQIAPGKQSFHPVWTIAQRAWLCGISAEFLPDWEIEALDRRDLEPAPPQKTRDPGGIVIGHLHVALERGRSPTPRASRQRLLIVYAPCSA